MMTCDECYGVGCNVCNGLGWESNMPIKREDIRMSTIRVEVGKFGQVTTVTVDGKPSHMSGNTVISEIKNLKAFVAVLGIENVEVVERAK